MRKRRRPVQHARRGYRRQNPDGGYTWVRSTTVNGRKPKQSSSIPHEVRRFVMKNKVRIQNIAEDIKNELILKGEPYKKDIIASLTTAALVKKGVISSQAAPFVKIGIMAIL